MWLAIVSMIVSAAHRTIKQPRNRLQALIIQSILTEIINENKLNNKLFNYVAFRLHVICSYGRYLGLVRSTAAAMCSTAKQARRNFGSDTDP